jgi:ribosomal protein S7
MDARLLFVQAFNHLRVPFKFIKGTRGGQLKRSVVFLPPDKQLNQGLHLLKGTIKPGEYEGLPAYQMLAAEMYAAWHKKGSARKKRTEVLKLAQASSTA